MPTADWRSPAAYEHLQTSDAPAFAWEFLSRNPDFQRDVQRMSHDAAEAPVDRDEPPAAFACRWGCDFDDCLTSAHPQPNWSPHALPSKLVLIDTPENLRGAAPALDNALVNDWPVDGADRTIVWRGRRIRLHRESTNRSASLSVAIPLDVLIDVRIAALRQLAAMLRNIDPGPDPVALTAARIHRLIDALRALDARRDGASYRDIAAALFGAAALPERGWKTHDLRDRTIRLVRYGEQLMRGGYRQLLLYPHRRRL